MTENPSMTFRTIFTSLRPPRIAFLLNRNDPDWMQACLRIIERSTMIWGGWYSCIVPTDGNTISEPFWKILERFDPDYVYSYSKTMADLKVFNPGECERWVERQLQDAQKRHSEIIKDQAAYRSQLEESLRQVPLDVYQISKELQDAVLRRLNPFHYDDERAIKMYWGARGLAVAFPLTPVCNLVSNLLDMPKITDIDFQASLPVQLLLYSMTGKMFPEFADQLGAQGVRVDVQRYATHELHEVFDALLREEPEFLGKFPRFLSLLNCTIYSHIKRREWLEQTVVVVGDSIDDFCLYYSLSRIKAHVYWLPSTLMHGLEQVMNSDGASSLYKYEREESLFANLSCHIYKRVKFEHPESRIALTSLSVDDSELLRAGTVLDQANLAGDKNLICSKAEIVRDVANFLNYKLLLYETHNVDRHYTEQFCNGESADFVNTPKPRSFKVVPPYGHFWISELRVEGYKLPQRPELSLATLKCNSYSTEEVRVSKEGLAYFSPNIGSLGGVDLERNLVRPKLKLLDALDLFSRVFEAEGLHISYSDKGNYHLHSVEKFGSLESVAAFFKSSVHRELFDRYIDKKSADNSAGVYVQERRFLDFAAIQNILGSQEKSESLIDDLIAKKVFHRGFIFHCESCRNADWYPVEDVGTTFTCSRCRATQVFKKRHWKSPQEPQWYYGLDEVVYQGYSHNMHIPMLTLNFLKSESREGFLYLPEVEVRQEPTSVKPYVELDICCCIDGEIVIGQATKESSLALTARREQERIRIHRDLADKLGAKSIILATFSSDWSSRTVDMANVAFSDKAARPRFLTISNFIPNHY